jgi:hypothetical protein
MCDRLGIIKRFIRFTVENAKVLHSDKSTMAERILARHSQGMAINGAVFQLQQLKPKTTQCPESCGVKIRSKAQLENFLSVTTLEYTKREIDVDEVYNTLKNSEGVMVATDQGFLTLEISRRRNLSLIEFGE